MEAVQSWSIGILCYNEEGSIENYIRQARKLVQLLAPEANEIVVLDDGSSDGSVLKIQALIAEFDNVRLIQHPKNLGIGEGVRSLHANFRKENVVIVPGDGQFDLEELLPYKIFSAKTFISFYRKENTVYSGFRNMLSWVNRYINRVLLGIRLKDVNWVKAYKKEEVQALNLRLKSSLVESEICSKLLINKTQVVEVESRYLARDYGESKGSSKKIVLQAIKDIVKLVMEIQLFRFRNP